MPVTVGQRTYCYVGCGVYYSKIRKFNSKLKYSIAKRFLLPVQKFQYDFFTEKCANCTRDERSVLIKPVCLFVCLFLYGAHFAFASGQLQDALGQGTRKVHQGYGQLPSTREH